MAGARSWFDEGCPTARSRVEWEHYQTIETLRHYVLVERDAPALQVFDRDGEIWRARSLDGVAATLDLPALGVTIPLAEIYADLFA